MSYIEQSLSEGEQVAHIFRLHWFSWFPVWMLYLLSVPTFGILLPVAIYKHLDLRTREYGVTNKRAIFKCGIISRKTQEMKLSSIETVEIEQGVIDRLFGLGTVRITGRGISDLTLSGIDNPLDVKRKIESVKPA